MKCKIIKWTIGHYSIYDNPVRCLAAVWYNPTHS